MKHTNLYRAVLLLVVCPTIFCGCSATDYSDYMDVMEHQPAVFPKDFISDKMNDLTAYTIKSDKDFSRYFPLFPKVDFTRHTLVFVQGTSANLVYLIGYKITHISKSHYNISIRVCHPGFSHPACDKWCCPILVKDLPKNARFTVDFQETRNELEDGYIPITYPGYH